MTKEKAWLLFINSISILSDAEYKIAKQAFLYAWSINDKKD